MNDSVGDVAFKVRCNKRLSADHRYHLFSAICEILPNAHHNHFIAIHPFTGKQLSGRLLELNSSSRLTIRAPIDRIGELLSIGGRTLRIGSVEVTCDTVPEVLRLIPACTLRSSFVTIKRSDKKFDEDSFIEAARKQLDTIGISESVEIELPTRESLKGDLRSARRTFSIKGRQIVGYEMRLNGLSADESIAVQSRGIGGRRAMGCGLFKAFRVLPQHPSLIERNAGAVSNA